MIGRGRLLSPEILGQTDRVGAKSPIFDLHRVSQKLCHYTFVHNFDKCWPIFKLLLVWHFPRNLQQNPCHNTHHTLDVSLHYLAKLRKFNHFRLQLLQTLPMIFQQGNVPAHRACETINFLKRDTCVHSNRPFSTQQHRSEPSSLQKYGDKCNSGYCKFMTSMN